MADAERHPSRRRFIATTTASAAAVPLAGMTSTTRTEALAVQGPQAVTISLEINGTRYVMTVEPRVTLLDAIRLHAGLTGTKKGCDQGTCGACTVLVNGKRIDSCLTLAIMHTGDRITTIEGLERGNQLHPLQEAFIKHDGFQCGYCTPGQIVSAAGMLDEGHTLDEETVRVSMSGNICRCGCYAHIVDAVLEAAKGR